MIDPFRTMFEASRMVSKGRPLSAAMALLFPTPLKRKPDSNAQVQVCFQGRSCTIDGKAGGNSRGQFTGINVAKYFWRTGRCMAAGMPGRAATMLPPTQTLPVPMHRAKCFASFFSTVDPPSANPNVGNASRRSLDALAATSRPDLQRCASAWSSALCDVRPVPKPFIAIGYLIGASVARALTTLLHQMKRRNAHTSVAAFGIGCGMGVAMAIEQ